MYLPALFVVTLREFLVERSARVTAASEMTAPDTSLTVPSTVPLLVDCAHVGKAAPTQSRIMRNKANLISIGLRMRHPPGSEKIPLVQPNTALVGDFRRVLKLVVSAQGSEAKLQSFHSLPPRICGAWIVGACTENPFKT